jgi:hypothetical protein
VGSDEAGTGAEGAGDMTTFEIVIVTVGFTVAFLQVVAPWPWRWYGTKDVYDCDYGYRTNFITR